MGRITSETREACRRCLEEYKATKRLYKQPRTFFKKLFGYCPCCEQYFKYTVKTKRRNTAYIDEAQNWLTACRECQELDEAYFADLWEQYYGSI